jgi:hypothetical protein
MPEEIARLTQNNGMVKLATGFRLTPTGIEIEGTPRLTQWGAALQRCGGVANATQWALGDLIVYAEGREDYGEMYSQYVELTSRSYYRVVQSAAVSREFPPGEARQYADRLSWTHHRYAMRLAVEDRAAMLQRAVDEDWTSQMMSEEVNVRLREARGIPSGRRSTDGVANGRSVETAVAVSDNGTPTTTPFVYDSQRAAPPEWPEKVTATVHCRDAAVYQDLMHLIGDADNRFHVVRHV